MHTGSGVVGTASYRCESHTLEATTGPSLHKSPHLERLLQCNNTLAGCCCHMDVSCRPAPFAPLDLKGDLSCAVKCGEAVPNNIDRLGRELAQRDVRAPLAACQLCCGHSSACCWCWQLKRLQVLGEAGRRVDARPNKRPQQGWGLG